MQQVSVIVPAYNPHPDWLVEAITSAVEQDPAPLEVLIVDDGSIVPVVYDHPQVRVIRKANGGVASARNVGIRQARGQFVALLDQDDIWHPGKLAAQLALMDENVGMCSTDADVLVDGRRQPWEYGKAGGAGVGYKGLLRGNTVTASTVLTRRDLVMTTGGFLEHLRYVDDWAMWLAITKYHEGQHVPDALVTYRIHATNASQDYMAMWRGDLQVLALHPGFRALTSVRRVSKAHAQQAWGAWERSRKLHDLAWATILWPDFAAWRAGRLMWNRLTRRST